MVLGRTPNACNILGICADCIGVYNNTHRPTGVYGGSICGIEENEPTVGIGYPDLYSILLQYSFPSTRTHETR